MNRSWLKMDHTYGEYPREKNTSSNIFNPMLIAKQERLAYFPSESGYYYKNYTISFSISTHCSYPHRVLSVTPHGFSPKLMKGPELVGLLEHFGFYSFLPIKNYSTEHPDDPYTGDTQYYSQMVIDLDNLKDPMFPRQFTLGVAGLSQPNSETA